MSQSFHYIKPKTINKTHFQRLKKKCRMLDCRSSNLLEDSQTGEFICLTCGFYWKEYNWKNTKYKKLLNLVYKLKLMEDLKLQTKITEKENELLEKTKLRLRKFEE